MLWTVLSLAGLLLWLLIFFLPWRPWSTREQLDSSSNAPADLSEVTVLIPARDEADTITAVLQSVYEQGQGQRVVLVDDQSSDGTAEAAAGYSDRGLEIVSGISLPEGWAGKLWALEQGRDRIDTPYTLLLDGDIRLAPKILATLLQKAKQENLQMVSLMAQLHMASFRERWLLPAFVYFFKLLYPFQLSNMPRVKKVAAAAGGCILLQTSALQKIGGFAVLRDALIDDCTLAARFKDAGYRTWIGLTHSVVSLRPYTHLGAIWNMVARTAFTQLRYSLTLLLLTSIVFILMFFVPVAGLFSQKTDIQVFSVIALLVMTGAYVPVLRYYGLSMGYALTMPVIGAMFLAMTWTSAWRYWFGRRSHWKGRTYNRSPGQG